MAVYSRPFTALSRPKALDKAPPRRAGIVITLALAVALMSLLYLIQIGRVATKGYELEQLNLQRIELERGNQQLLFQIEQAQSLEYVRARAVALGLEPIKPTQIRYLTISMPTQSTEIQAR